MSSPDDSLAQLLRQELTEATAGVQPGWPGLDAVHARIDGRPPRPWLFSLLTVVGSAVWNALFIGLGWLLGDRWTEVGTYSDVINYVVVGGVVLVCALLLARRAVRRRRGLDPVTGEPAERG